MGRANRQTATGFGAAATVNWVVPLTATVIDAGLTARAATCALTSRPPSVVTSSRRWVLMHELRGAHEPSFEEQVRHLSPCDLLVVEGFKHAPIPKLEVWRAVTGEALLHPNDPHIVAVASDAKVETRLPLLDLNDAPAIVDFILRHQGLA